MQKRVFWALLLTSSAWASQQTPVPCPIKSSLDPKIHTLTQAELLKISKVWPDAPQISGVTKSDFGSIRPWRVSKCGGQYCASPENKALQHQVFVRPERLKDGRENPRWIPVERFPCGNVPSKNFITYSCTIEHEKVHVVQRDDALQAACPAFVRDLKGIRENSEGAAQSKAQQAYQKLLGQIGQGDQEEVPYQIEWQCNATRAEKSGVACGSVPQWSELAFLKDLVPKEVTKTEIQFKKGAQALYTANLIPGAARLRSAGPLDGCAKKEWFFSGRSLEQESCFHEDGTITKVFYEFGRKQRAVDVNSAHKKLKETVFFDPRERILQD